MLNTRKVLFQPQNKTVHLRIFHQHVLKILYSSGKELEMTQELHYREQREVETSSLLSHFLSSGHKNKLDGCRWDPLPGIVLKIVCKIKGLGWKKKAQMCDILQSFSVVKNLKTSEQPICLFFTDCTLLFFINSSQWQHERNWDFLGFWLMHNSVVHDLDSNWNTFIPNLVEDSRMSILESECFSNSLQ